jgi:hypothetical protein
MSEDRAEYQVRQLCRECGTVHSGRCPVCEAEIKLWPLWKWMVENCVEVTREQRQSMAQIIGGVYT